MSETITQADRDAVADYLSARARASFANSKEPHAALLLDAFALHRARERQAIVDWLLSMKRDDTNWPQHLAKRIERGEHLEAPSHE